MCATQIVCISEFLQVLLRMLKKTEQGWLGKELSLTNSTLKSVIFIFVPGHAGVEMSELTCCLVGPLSRLIQQWTDVPNTLRIMALQ
jgi:hypothetical protein